MNKKPASLGIASRFSKFLSVERVIIGGTVLFTLVVVGAIVVGSLLNQAPSIDYTVPDLSEQVLILGRDHIEVGQEHAPYNSNPPTSGPHYVQPAAWGIYREVLPDEQVIHNLEHSGIWISYRDAEGEETVRQLEDIARRYRSQVIVTHRPSNDSLIAVAAWGRLLELDTVDTAQIYNFIARYRGRLGPENVS